MAENWSSQGGDLHVDWQPGSGSRGLADALRRAIRDGRLEPGASLPSTRSLAADLGLARGTVTRVYADLTAEGYLHSSQGSPTKVAVAGTSASPPAGVLPPGSATHPEPGRPALPPGPAVRWDLFPGRPDLSSFPRAMWLSAARRVVQQAPSRAFDYGDPLGAAGLREALARYLGRSRGVLADPEHIVVCGGFRHAITVLASALASRGVGEIAFEDPSLPQLREAAAATGLRVTGVPVDDLGARVAGPDCPAVVLTPSHQFPLGVTMSPGRRRELVSWAARTGGVVIEDDYDGEFRFDRTPVGTLQGLMPDQVVYAGTASKAIAPALRVGWLVLPRALVQPVGAAITLTGWRPPVIDHLILAELMDSGAYDRHVRQRRAAYRRRRDRLLNALPSWATPVGIAAGLHLLVMLPPSGPAEAGVLAAARRNGVAIDGLGRYWMTGGPAGLVVGYATPPDHAFGPAVDALVASLHAAFQEQPGVATAGHHRQARPASGDGSSRPM
jgi:GntR family transcriptional regulator / MocR family aminotransferase